MAIESDSPSCLPILPLMLTNLAMHNGLLVHDGIIELQTIVEANSPGIPLPLFYDSGKQDDISTVTLGRVGFVGGWLCLGCG